jgi:uncharacterized membrane protein
MAQLQGLYAGASDINDNGLAVGAVLMANQSSHAAKWPKGAGVSDLNLVGQWSVAYGVNLIGDIVGVGTFFSDGGSGGPMHAVLWPAQGGSVADLGTGHAYDISNKGRIVGSTHEHAPFTARTAGSPRLLLPLPSGAVAVEAQAVNTCGAIAGRAHNGSGV